MFETMVLIGVLLAVNLLPAPENAVLQFVVRYAYLLLSFIAICVMTYLYGWDSNR